MTSTLKWLGGGVAAVMLLGLAGLFSGEVAEAQPSGPPHRFAGSVSIDGEAAAAGTSVTAIVDGAECGSATVITSAAGSTYALDVPDECANAGDTVSFQVGGYDAAETGTWSGGGRTDLALTASTAMPEDPMDDMDDMADECPPADDMADEPMEPGEDEAEEPMEPGEEDMGDDMADDCPDDMAEEPMEPGDDDMAEEPMEPGDDMAEEPMEEDMADEPMDDDMAPEAGDTGTGLATSTTSSLAAILGVTALAVLLGSYTFARRRR